MTQSLWLATREQKNFPSLSGDIETDFAIVGGGITGIVAAWLLSQAGHRVIVLEAHRVGGGETGHTTAHLTEQVDAGFLSIEKEHGAEAARLACRAGREAIDTIERICAAEGIDCDFERLPAFLYATDNKGAEALREETEAARRAGISASWTEQVPLPYATAGAMRIERQAQFHPLRFVRSLAERLPEGTARIFESTRVVNVEDGAPALVRTEHGTVRARQVLVTANVPVNQRGLLQTKLTAYRTYAIASRLTTPIERALFWDDEDPYHYVRTWSSNGDTWIIIGGEDHRTGSETDTDSRFENVAEWARPRFAIPPPELRWSGQIIEPPDGLPYIGRNSLSEHVWVASGYSGQGMTFGTFSGSMLSELTQGNTSPWEELFSPRRLPVHSAAEYIKENLEFPKRLVTDRILHADVEKESLAGLAAGDGKILEIEGKRCAASRNESGAVTLVSAICPHLGCDVRWNRGERSWDCPCHGSRFSPEGEVLNGPAAKNLERVEGSREGTEVKG